MKETPAHSWPPPLFLAQGWQMSFGERAALEGILAQTRPGLSIEIGTAEGGSLSLISSYSDEVHAIDLVPPETPAPANVEVHVGDSKEVMPKLLAGFAKEGRNVDFTLVDGDHSTEGVRTDLVNLLSSDATRRTLILLHDTMNEAARAGIRSVAFEDFPKVRYAELDLLTGYMGRQQPFKGQLWGGFGVVIVDDADELQIDGSIQGDPRYYDAHSMIGNLGGSFESEQTVPTGLEAYCREEARRVGPLSAELDEHRRLLEEQRRLLESVERSASWRITAPLRAMKRFAMEARGRRARRQSS